MVGISEVLKEELICDLPVFRENARKFFDGEISVKDYKGLSGPFGSYAEKGAGCHAGASLPAASRIRS